MNTGTEYKLMLRDSFEEVDDQNGHLKKMLTKAVLNSLTAKSVLAGKKSYFLVGRYAICT